MGEGPLRVAGGARAAGEARAALSDRLGGRLGDERLRELHLVVSEIVNNSVLHGQVGEDGWIEITCSVGHDHVKVEVRDSGVQGDPVARRPNFDDGGGFGLFLVDALSRSWGVVHDPRLQVWFELGLGEQT